MTVGLKGLSALPPTYKHEFNSEKYASDASESGRRTPAWYALPSELHLMLLHKIIPDIIIVDMCTTISILTLSPPCVGVTAFSRMGREPGYFRTRGRSLRFLITAL